eukprot:CAMPEP_0178817700 /NCGR_PEP_ID=MMETSP0746-20121128/2033_1 /TAXON_ID=913974 /ORGANISM="Nitzschia punctata, Strain CCMP561" /LENGTH=128 /DNA_ID=CAMNT_0020478825 /DNA_START=114 /DNA_END=497 /DNA_ORIENTATION=-
MDQTRHSNERCSVRARIVSFRHTVVHILPRYGSIQNNHHSRKHNKMDRKPRHIPHSNFGFLGNLANELFEDSFDSPQPLTSFDGFVQIDGDPGIPLEIAMPFQTHPSNNAHGSHDSFLKECEEGCVYF